MTPLEHLRDKARALRKAAEGARREQEVLMRRGFALDAEAEEYEIAVSKLEAPK